MIKTLNRQEMFDIMYLGLMKQGCQSINQWGGCKYRGPDDRSGAPRKCAVGFLIPDEEYNDQMETDTTISPSSVVGEALVAGGVPLEEFGFLHMAQHVHDQYEFEDWEAQFAVLAGKHGLGVPDVPVVE